MAGYIKGMEMPIGNEVIYIFSDGTAQKAVLAMRETLETGKAVPVPPHGRLIDADCLYNAVEQRYRMSSGIEHRCERDLLDVICGAPAIIPASEEGET